MPYKGNVSSTLAKMAMTICAHHVALDIEIQTLAIFDQDTTHKCMGPAESLSSA